MRVPSGSQGPAAARPGFRIGSYDAEPDLSAMSAPLLKQPKQPRGRKAADVLMLTILPWSVFTLTVGLLTFCLQDFAPVVYVVVIATGMLALSLLALGTASGRPSDGTLGFLTLVAVGVGVLIGHRADSSYMNEFWKLDADAEYHQVSPAAAGALYFDAGLLEFLPEAHVDLKKSLGMRHLGKLYCVAPVVGKGLPATSVPQFWAVGEDCCETRGSFQCGDLALASAHFGVAVADETGNFEKAAKMALSVYKLGMPTSPPLFVRWTSDAKAYKNALWTGAERFALTASCLHLVGSLLVGMLLSKRTS